MMRVLLVLLLAAPLAQADLHLERVTEFGCQIHQSEGGSFSLDVWAKQEPEPEYRLLLSVRPKREQAMKDCSKWMDDMHHKFKDVKSQAQGGKR